MLSSSNGQLQWYRSDASYAHVPREFRSIGRFHLVAATQPAGYYVRKAEEEMTLQLNVGGAVRGVVDHGSKFVCESRSGSLVLSPVRTTVTYDVRDPLDIVIASLPETEVAQAIEVMGLSWDGDFGRLHTTLFEHDAIRALLVAIWNEAADGSPRGTLFAESAWQTMMLALHTAAGRQALQERPRGGLAPWQTRRVAEFLKARFAEDVSLTTLAGLVNLSTFHFARMFKQSTGLPPHAYLRRLRCERAKELLLATRLSVTEIAAQVGYDTPQAFSRMFRSTTGTTPQHYRRDRAA